MFHHLQPPLAIQSPSEAGYGAAAPGQSLREAEGQDPYPAVGLDSSLLHAAGLSDAGAPSFFSGPAATFAQPGPAAACPTAAEFNSFAQQPNGASSTALGAAASLEAFLARSLLEPGAEEQPVPSRSSQRRKRTVYRADQQAALKEAFAQNMRPDIRRREELASLMGIPEDRLQVWFQNRRARYRKARKACSNPDDAAVLGCNSHAKDVAPVDLQAPLPVVWQQQYFLPALVLAGSPCTPRAPYSARGPSRDREMAVAEQSHYRASSIAQSALVKEGQQPPQRPFSE